MSVYDFMKDFGWYVFEAVNKKDPDSRVYHYINDLAGLRGEKLVDYVDQCVELVGENEEDDGQQGFNDSLKLIRLTMTPEEFVIEQQKKSPEYLAHLMEVEEEKKRMALIVQAHMKGKLVRKSKQLEIFFKS